MNKKSYMYIYDINNKLQGTVYIKNDNYIVSLKNINSFFRNIDELRMYIEENFKQLKLLPFKLF